MVDTRYDSPSHRMVDDLAAGRIDVALLWGPLAGYFAAQQGDALTITPLVHEAKADRMDYFIAMGVRPGEHRWKHEIDQVVSDEQGPDHRHPARIPRPDDRPAGQSDSVAAKRLSLHSVNPLPPCGGRSGWGGSAAAMVAGFAEIALVRHSRGSCGSTPIQLRLSSLCSPRLRILPPQGGKMSA